MEDKPGMKIFSFVVRYENSYGIHEQRVLAYTKSEAKAAFDSWYNFGFYKILSISAEYDEAWAEKLGNRYGHPEEYSTGKRNVVEELQGYRQYYILKTSDNAHGITFSYSDGETVEFSSYEEAYDRMCRQYMKTRESDSPVRYKILHVTDYGSHTETTLA